MEMPLWDGTSSVLVAHVGYPWRVRVDLVNRELHPGWVFTTVALTSLQKKHIEALVSCYYTYKTYFQSGMG
jgi:hypothetical protein